MTYKFRYSGLILMEMEQYEIKYCLVEWMRKLPPIQVCLNIITLEKKVSFFSHTGLW